MNDQQYLATLVRELYPDNGIEFLSGVVATLHDEHMLRRIVQILELETIAPIIGKAGTE